MLRAIEEGYVQREIAEAAYREQQEVESGRRVIVGQNRFQQPTEHPPAILRVDSDVVIRQAARLARVRAERSGARVRAALGALDEAAGGEENLLPRILECVRGYATIGELCDTLRRRLGAERAPEAVD